VRAFVLGLLLLATSCAGTTFRRIASESDDLTADGIRYYESAPFLLVYTDGKGGLRSEIKFLPDTTTKRSVDPFAVLAQNESTLTFTNGVLSQSKTVIDETPVPKAIISALEKVAAAAIAAANAPGDPPTQTDLPLPRLYRILITKDAVTLEGGKVFSSEGVEIDTIRATISQPGSSSQGDGGAADESEGEGKKGGGR
jgi:hypothetical protein